MAFGVAILAGAKSALGFVKESITWFISIIPKPLKFFLFLYMILFFGTLIVPQIVGVGTTCNSQGVAYKTDFIQRYSDTVSLEWQLSYCEIEGLPQQTYTPIDGIIQLFNFIKTRLTTGNDPADYMTNSTAKTEFCSELEEDISQLDADNEFLIRDLMLQRYGEEVTFTDYKSLVNVQCTYDEKDNEYYPSLYFYSIDIFHFDIWLVLGLFGVLVILAFKYYAVAIRN